MTESSLFGYEQLGNWNCNGGSFNASSSQVMLGENQTNVTCTVTNQATTGKIIIIKDSRPNDGYDFPFTINGTSFSDAFELDDCEDSQCPPQAPGDDNLDNSTSYDDLIYGNYTIYENIPESVQGTWSLVDVSCESQSGESEITNATTGDAGGSIRVDLAPDDEVTCTFINESEFPTRTQGFWKTHTAITEALFENPPAQESADAVGFTNSTIIIGNTTSGVVIDDIREVFGLYWGSNSKTSTGDPRNADEQVFIVMIHQLLTAKLNCGQFGCGETAIDLISQCDDAFASGNVTAIQSVDTSFPGSGCTEELDWYNNSGEVDYPFPPGASPKASKNLANETVPNSDPHYDDTGISRWDNPNPQSPAS